MPATLALSVAVSAPPRVLIATLSTFWYDAVLVPLEIEAPASVSVSALSVAL